MNKVQKGKFIVFEGIDGSGISTQTQRLQNYLESEHGIKSILAKEPSEGPLGMTLRQVLSGRMSGIDNSCLALLFAADRIDHNNNKIIPALEQGKYVICDRYLWSSYAYQGMKNNYTWIEEINKLAYRPDLTIFIKVRPETSLTRITTSRLKTEIFEKVEILQKVLENYIEIYGSWKNSGEPVVEINGEQELKIVEKEIRKAVDDYLALKA